MTAKRGGYKLQEAADLAAVSKSTAHAAEKAGKLGKRNNNGLLRAEAVERWIAGRERGGAPYRIRSDLERDCRVLATVGPAHLAEALRVSGRCTFMTKGQIGGVDVLRTCVGLAGPGAAVNISVWRIGKDSLLALREMLADKRITSLRVVVDHAFASLTGPRREHMKLAIEVLGHVVHETKCHAKFMTIRGPNGNFAVRSSANLNRITRWEQFDVDDDPALCDFLDAWVATVCEHVNSGLATPIGAIKAGYKAAFGSPDPAMYRAKTAAEVAAEFEDAIERADTAAAIAVLHRGEMDNVDATLAAADEIGDADAGGGETLTQIRKRHERAKADRAEMLRDELAGELVRLAALRKSWFEFARALRERLLTVPARVGAEVAAISGSDPAAVDAIIASEIRLVLERIADSRMPHEDKSDEGAP